MPPIERRRSRAQADDNGPSSRTLRPLKQRIGVGPALACAMLVAAACTATAYWPGLMTWDAARQYGQALDGRFDDWHPPAMEWLWRQLIPLHDGLVPMLVLQLALYWGGFALLAGWALRIDRMRLAVALAACGLLPLALALMGAVLKDCLMAGALVSATGLLLWGRREASPATKFILRATALALLLCAATLRFNAFTACLPLFVALVPASFRRTPLRGGATAIAATIVLMFAMPLANRALGAEKSGVELSLIIFDLGGITERSGVDAFPAAMRVSDPVRANHGCYSPVKWDPYSYWVDPLCPLGFDPFRRLVARHHLSPYRLWVSAILAHPFAYAEHRLEHFNINTRFLVHGAIERPVQVASAPNDWHYRVTPSALLSALDDLAVTSAATPVGWPIVWLAVALAALVAGAGLPSRGIIVPIALSALLYGLGYAVFSVAAELRYHLWTMIGALIAAVITVADLSVLPVVPWARVRLALAPVAIVIALATLWRILPG